MKRSLAEKLAIGSGILVLCRLLIFIMNKPQPFRCKKEINATYTWPGSSTVPLSSTTCSASAWARGDHQRVVAFVLYGSADTELHQERKYYQGLEQNLAAVAAEYGAGWTVRLYHNLGPGHPQHEDISALASDCQQELDLCYVADLPSGVREEAAMMAPMVWRFLPTRDPQVEVLLSRDLDSRVTSREATAVREWLGSGKAVHSMRDHFSHVEPLLGGLWGARLGEGENRQRWRTTWQAIMMDPDLGSFDYGVDQNILAKYVWPWAQNNSMEHDSYHCNTYPNSRGFPTQREYSWENFVGNAVNIRSSNWLWKECPQECRRQQGWSYC